MASGAILANAVLYQWLGASLVRFFPEHRNNQPELVAIVLSGFLAASLVTTVVGLALAILWVPGIWTRLILIGIVLTWVQAWYLINLELMRSHLAPVRYGLASVLRSCLALGIGTALIVSGFEAYGALGGLIGGFGIAGLWASRKQWGIASFRELHLGLAKRILAYGLPLAASFGLSVIISSTDRFMLAGLIGQSAAGLYAASQGLAQQTVTILMTMVSLAAYPLILRTLETIGPDAAREQLRSNAILLLGVALPATAGLSILSERIADVFLGPQFRHAGGYLIPWLALAMLLAGVRAYYFDLAFYLGKRTKIQMIVMLGAAILNVGLNIWLIPLLGLLGAAYSTVAALAVAVILSAALGRLAFRLPSIAREFVKLGLATITMGLVVYFMPTKGGVLGLSLSVFVGVFIYAFMVYALDIGELRKVAAKYFTRIVNSRT